MLLVTVLLSDFNLFSLELDVGQQAANKELPESSKWYEEAGSPTIISNFDMKLIP